MGGRDDAQRVGAVRASADPESSDSKTLITAYTGFRAAVVESAQLTARPARVAVHTGYCGCGAFGGNRELMALLQVVAARMAGLERQVFHTGSPDGEETLAEAQSLIAELTGGDPIATTDLLAARRRVLTDEEQAMPSPAAPTSPRTATATSLGLRRQDGLDERLTPAVHS